MPLPFTVYILRCSDGALYIGRATNLAMRLSRHAAGRGCQFTASRLPVTLVWTEPHPSWESATARETQIKNWTRAKKEALIRGDIAELKRLSKCTHRPPNENPALPA